MNNAGSSLEFMQVGTGSSSAMSTGAASDDFVFADASTDLADTAAGSASAFGENNMDFAEFFAAANAAPATPAASDIDLTAPVEEAPVFDISIFDALF